MEYVQISEIIVPEDHRELRPWKVVYFVKKMELDGYNESYPIIIEEPNILVDGQHRLEAARSIGLIELPYLPKPEGVSRIRHAIRCNEDGADTEKNDVFDYAQLCWQLSKDGWTGQQIAEELGWNTDVRIYQHKGIKEGLHPNAWNLARGLTRKDDLLDSNEEALVSQKLTNVSWSESHFRTLLKYLPHHFGEDGKPDRPIMRAQIRAIREILARFADPSEKVTARWISGHCANRHTWWVKLKRYADEVLDNRVSLRTRINLFKNIHKNVYGKAKNDDNLMKFIGAIANLNKQVLGITLYCDDSFQRIPTLEDKSIDLIVTDPPYNVIEQDWDQIGTDEEYLEWMTQWFDLIKPKLADDYHLFIFCSLKYQARVELLIEDKIGPVQTHWVWSHPNITKGRDTKYGAQEKWDMIFHCGTHPLNFPPEWKDKERSAVQAHAMPQSNFVEDKRLHPNITQKPLSLIKLFVELGSADGDTVLDLFAGSGTTGHACKEIGGRECILIEKSDEYCKVIEDRLGIKREEI